MRINRLSLIRMTIVAIPLTALVAQHASAWPTNSPSARAAARLKYHPPQNWIRHYLGDDRYKIAGGIWNVVSTQTDTYYHRATCPNMLRQSANIVIGFNKSSDAAEAGYRADPTCQPGATAVIYEVSGTRRSSSTATANVPAVFTNRARATRTIVLADGKSTVGLPSGWSRLQSARQSLQGGYLALDVLQPPSRRGRVTLATISLPGLDTSQITSASKMRASLRQFSNLTQRSGVVNNNLSQLSSIADNVVVQPIRLAGLSGVVISPPKGGTRLGGLGRSWFVARGQVLYAVDDYSRGTRGVNTILSTYRPR